MGKTYRDIDRAKIDKFNKDKWSKPRKEYRQYINSVEYQDSEVQLNSSLSQGVTYDNWNYNRRSGYRYEGRKKIAKGLEYSHKHEMIWGEPLNRWKSLSKPGRFSTKTWVYRDPFTVHIKLDSTYYNVTPESKGCVHKYEEMLVVENRVSAAYSYLTIDGNKRYSKVADGYTTYSFDITDALFTRAVVRDVCTKCKIIKR